MILFVSVFAGLSVFVFLCIVIKKVKSMEQFQTKVRLQSLSETTVRFAEERRPSAVMTTRDWESLSFTERIITPIRDTIQKFFMRMAPRAIFKTIERQIVVAGKQNVWSVDKVIFAWGTTIVICFGAGLFIFFTSDLMLIQRLVMLLMLIAIGVILPMSYLRTKIQERQEKIISELPPFLDLLSVSVQAGLSFDASVDRILRRSSGALMDEFRQMQKDLRLGLSKKEALHEMANRCDLEDMYLFTTSVIQSERLGTSMGKTLVEQAKNMRERYQQRIKAKALKAPIKILFPLVLLIFPTIFIIILLPPIISVLNNMGLMP
ncbi:MAG: type II secretion system F family protein [Selenomonadaceae bacterium]|nr:type II secretion system F family protein [Selenomonadaceae bacterium]